MQKRTKGFVKIDKVISYHSQDKKLHDSLWRYRALKSWEQAVSEFFEEAKELSKAMDLKNGVLFVACLSKELAHKLKLFAEKIVETLNRLLGRIVVYALVVEG